MGDERMQERESAIRAGSSGSDDGETEARDLSWAERISSGDDPADVGGRGDGAGRLRSPAGRTLVEADGDPVQELLDEQVERLRVDAVQLAREDASNGVPEGDDGEFTPGGTALRRRCQAAYERWKNAERRRLRDVLTDREETVSRLLGKAGLLLDRMDRLTNELIRLKARWSTRRQEVQESLGGGSGGRTRLIPTKVYVAAISFLGVVEFFANAPVFSSLLPRDPLTERQIRIVAETSEGWMAGMERVLAQLVFRPDAALLAAGVIVFLLVLAHFFGHSLREYVSQRDEASHRDTVTNRSPMENLVPLVLTGVGLVLVLGVLFEARVILGDVGERRFTEDIAVVEELRREAGWARADGNLVEANELANRAEDMEAAATQLREFAISMSEMTFPILLLNITLVLAAITAAYFHKRTRSREQFNEAPYERDRRDLIESIESTADEVATVLARSVRPLRELRSLAEEGPRQEPEAVARRLESVLSTYRSQLLRARDGHGGASGSDPAHRKPIRLDLPTQNGVGDLSSHLDAAREYEQERKRLSGRFEDIRMRFNEQLETWEPDEMG